MFTTTTNKNNDDNTDRSSSILPRTYAAFQGNMAAVASSMEGAAQGEPSTSSHATRDPCHL